jgi:hypothetical protein
MLFSLDKALHQASSLTSPPSERELYQEFLKHARGQLCLHLATLVLKKAKKVIFCNSTQMLNKNFDCDLEQGVPDVRFQVLTASMRFRVFWDVALCSHEVD